MSKNKKLKREAEELATREPYGMRLHQINPTTACLGPYIAKCKRSGGPWFLQYQGRLLCSEDIKILFLLLIKEIDRRPVVRKSLPTYNAAPPNAQQDAATCDDPELDAYYWNRSRCRYWEHSMVA